MNRYTFLKDRNIINILIGDKINDCNVSMPYKTTNDLQSMCASFDLVIKEQNISRWQYFSRLLDHVVKNNKIELLFNELFNIEVFFEQLKSYSEDEKNIEYNKIVQCIIDKINSLNKNSDYQLYFQDGFVYVDNKDCRVFNIITPTIDKLSFEYIRKKRNEAIKDIRDGQFDSALTKVRTLLEDTIKYKLHDQNIENIDNLDFSSLYNKYLKQYGINLGNEELNLNTRNILSSLSKIIKSIGEVRNKASDGHGHGKKRIELDENIAYFYLNTAVTMAEFMLIFENSVSND